MDLITNGSQLHGSAMPRILAKAQSLMIGRTIVAVGYVEQEDGNVWPCIELDNGTTLTVSRDDEGNGPGSLFIQTEDDGETLCRTSLA